jgi:hypothetical protein
MSNIRSDAGGNLTFKAVAGEERRIFALRKYGEVAAATAGNRGTFKRATTDAGSDDTSSEKLNTRTASVTLRVATGSGNTVLVAGQADFGRNAWLAPRHYAHIIIDDTVGAACVWGFNSTPEAFAWSDKLELGRTIRGRRPKRYGTWALGNQINRFEKTGGGAYSAIAPTFETDNVWVDQSQWRNGHHQSDVWNIQLFGTAGPLLFRYQDRSRRRETSLTPPR